MEVVYPLYFGAVSTSPVPINPVTISIHNMVPSLGLVKSFMSMDINLHDFSSSGHRAPRWVSGESYLSIIPWNIHEVHGTVKYAIVCKPTAPSDCGATNNLHNQAGDLGARVIQTFLGGLKQQCN